eukprot:8996543-Lingulodinium_polyedra.AAC.1
MRGTACVEEVVEEELIVSCFELRMEDIRTEAQLYREQCRAQLIINRLVDEQRGVEVIRPSADPMRPEFRVL